MDCRHGELHCVLDIFVIPINILLLCSGMNLSYMQIRGKLQTFGSLFLQVLSFQILLLENSRHLSVLRPSTPLPQFRETTRHSSRHPNPMIRPENSPGSNLGPLEGTFCFLVLSDHFPALPDTSVKPLFYIFCPVF